MSIILEVFQFAQTHAAWSTSAGIPRARVDRSHTLTSHVHDRQKLLYRWYPELRQSSSELQQEKISSIKKAYIAKSVGRESRYSDSLRAGHSGDRIPVVARFSAPVQTGPGAHPASNTMGTGPFPLVKRPGRLPPTPSSAEVKERVELYIYFPSGPSWPVLEWNLPLPLPLR